ncbi:MAG: ABC transporter substrate-binding protein [Acetobacteraceae bacterium]
MRCCPLPPALSRKGRGRIAAFLVLWVCLEIPASSSARPYEGPAHTSLHVVSLNLCTDQMLVLLAPEKIAALSTLARDPSLSYVAPQAVQLPIVRASAEAVLRLRPDLVVAAPYGAQTTLALLQQEGVPVLRVALPHDFAGIREMTRLLAATLGVPQRGEALLAAMDARLDKLLKPDHDVRALVWEPRGLTAGPGTLMDAVLRAAGLDNASDGSRASLETLLRHPPDVLVVQTVPSYPSLATALLDHPALAGLPRREIPPALTICAGPFSAEAAALLAR